MTRLRQQCLLALCLSTAFTAILHGQDLPIVTYTGKEGLPHDAVQRLVLDSQGFLWIGGATALARFDGERFATYARAAGLDVATGVNDIRPGRYRRNRPDHHSQRLPVMAASNSRAFCLNS